MLLPLSELDPVFCIEVDFERNSSGSPSRVFEAMGGLVHAFETLDIHLAHAVHEELKTHLILTDIEPGSIKTWLRTAFLDIHDEDIMQHGWKAFTRAFMVKAKHLILKFLAANELDGVSIKDLQDKIHHMAEETNARKIPSYGMVKRGALVDFCDATTEAVSALSENDSAKYIGLGEESKISGEHPISEETKEEILIQESSESELDLVLPVKKPDYLGQSKWEFKHEGHKIEATLHDKDWLEQFQEGTILLSPGDSLSARVKLQITEGFEKGETHVNYDIIKVNKVIRGHKQFGLFGESEQAPSED